VPKPQSAERRDPDRQDELLVLLLMSVFGDDSIQVTDVMKQADQSVELRQALEHIGIANGRSLGRWLEHVAKCHIDGAHVAKIGVNNRGSVWRIWRT
jgi:hypothetical protein